MLVASQLASARVIPAPQRRLRAAATRPVAVSRQNAADAASSRRQLLAGASVLLLSSVTGRALAEETVPLPGAGPLVQELLKKSKDNKEKNDKERFNYDKQYASYFAIEKGTSSWVPEDQATRDKLGYSRPAECNFGFFKESNVCKAFDDPAAKKE